MGQKVNPNGMRLGITRDWDARWYADADADYSSTLINDIKVRDYLRKRLANAGISRIQIDRPAQNAYITITSARPGIVIGKQGDEIEKLRKKVSQLMGGVPVQININEIRKPELNAELVAENLASQLERRVMFRRAMKRVVQNTMRQGALGIKVTVSGRLGGAEIARTEWYREGRVPLQTFRADVNYATRQAHTTYGVIGVKVWIYRGEILSREEVESQSKKKQIKESR